MQMLVTVASLYLFALRRVLRLSTWQTESGSTRTSSLQPLRRTYANMAITICAFSILGLTTSTTVVVMAAVPRGFVDPTFAQIFVLLPLCVSSFPPFLPSSLLPLSDSPSPSHSLSSHASCPSRPRHHPRADALPLARSYAFALLGLPSSILLFARAFDAKRESSRSHTRVSVNVNVVSFTEGPLPASPSPKRHSQAVPYLDARRGLALPVPQGFELVDRGATAHGLEHSSGPVHLAHHGMYPSLEVRASNSSLDKDGRPFDEYAQFPPEPTPTTLGAARPDSVYSVGSLEGGGGVDVVARPDPFGAAALEGTAALSLGAAPPGTSSGSLSGVERELEAKRWRT